MGFTEDVMQSFIEKEIRSHFPKRDGWNQIPVASREDSGRVIRVSRYFLGSEQNVIVGTTFHAIPSPDHVAAVNTLSQETRSCRGKYILVPQGTDTSEVPDDIRVLWMRSFGFDQSKLVWLTKKRNAMQFVKSGLPEPDHP